MKILFLDDDPSRRRYARDYFLGHELSEAETAEQAIGLLKKYSPYDLVMLDHDLGGKTFVPSDEVSGYHVAEYIAGMLADVCPKSVIVHSYNFAGADRMMRVLTGIVPVEYRPFSVDLAPISKVAK